MRHVLFIAAVMAVLTGSGCVSVRHECPPESRPKPIAAAGAKQFDGVFSNRSIDPKTGQTSDRSAQLFDFLTGRGHSDGNRGTQVDVQSSANGAVLRARLLDEQGAEIDSALLHRDMDFELSRGFVSLRGPFSGWHGRSGNMGAGVQNQRSRLYVASTGEVLGKRSESGAGFLFYFVPVVGASKGWMLWQKAY